MKSFYEIFRDGNARLEIQKNTPHEFPAHFHSSMEIFILKKGRYRVLQNGAPTEISDGCIVVTDCFQIHAYEQLETVGEDCVLIVPYAYLEKFNLFRQGGKIENAILRDCALCDTLLNIVNAYLVAPFGENVRQAGVELLLSILSEKLTFTKEKWGNEEELIRGVLSYIHAHFQDKISREKIAKEFGYAPEHISRVFHRYVGTSLSLYVNGLRLEYIERRRKS